MKVTAIIAQPVHSPTESKLFKLFADKPGEVFDANESGVSDCSFKRFAQKHPQFRVFLRGSHGSPKMLTGSVAAVRALLKALPERAYTK